MSLPRITSISYPRVTTTKLTGTKKVQIYVCWTSLATYQEIQAIISGVEQVLELTNYSRTTILQGTRPFSKGNTDWYQKSALLYPQSVQGYGPQVQNGPLIWGIYNETQEYNQKHFTVVIVDHDLSRDSLGFALGEANADYGFVVSIARFRDINDTGLRLSILQRCARHEMAHVLDVPLKGRIASGHCSNDRCSMNWCTGIDQFIFEERNGISFCSNCLNDLKSLPIQ